MNYNPLPLLIGAVGLYLLIKLRFFFVIHPIRTVKHIFGSIKEGKAFSSLALALAGTLGVGNIFGVAVGIITGGAGSVLWLILSSLFSSVLKYSEIVLAKDRFSLENGSGCAFSHVIKESFKHIGGIAAVIYAAATLGLSLVMGSAMQSKAVVDCMSEISDTPPALIAILLSIALLFTILGGVKKIQSITSILIPASTIVYIVMSLSALAVHSSRLVGVVALIFSSAFSPEAISGGVIGFLFSSAVREGFCRGMLSNEAGAGTSSSAHTSNSISQPARAGLMGIVEVFFDTTLLCTLTALVILTAVPDVSVFDSGMMLVNEAFVSSLGGVSGMLLAMSVLVFAYSTMICWYYYGSEALFSLLGRRHTGWFALIFTAFCVLGYIINEALLISITDLLMLVLSLLCLVSLIKNSDRIKKLSELGGVI